MSARPSSTTQAVVLEAFQDAMESAHGYRPQVFASGVLVNSRDADRFEGYQLALTAAQQTEAKCCMCGASVDTRENGTPGAQLTDGRWTCSDSCWERAAGDQTEARGVVDGIIDSVRHEIERATAKFPTWPTDPLHACGVVQEESGELAKAALQAVYEPHKSTRDDVATEAIQTAAMAIRFLASMDRYDWKPGEQHEQGAALTEARNG